MNKITKTIMPIIFFMFCVLPTLAIIGVGVGTGKIQIDEELKPGSIYRLPSLTVLNTGDESSDYEVSVEYHENQKELRPEEAWFIFSPKEFYLEPGEAKTVDIKLNLPLKMEPGNYFGYLEAHPLKKSQQGQTSIGVAAAAKLYFTVIPANLVLGIYYKAASFWKVYSPWPQRTLTLLVIVVIVILFKKFFNINIDLKKNKKKITTLTDNEN